MSRAGVAAGAGKGKGASSDVASSSKAGNVGGAGGAGGAKDVGDGEAGGDGKSEEDKEGKEGHYGKANAGHKLMVGGEDDDEKEGEGFDISRPKPGSSGFVSAMRDEFAELRIMGASAPRKHRPAVAAASTAPEEGGQDIELVTHPKSDEAKSGIKDILRSHFLFSTLDEEHLEVLADAMFDMQVEEGQHVINQGDNGDYFYVIESGQFDIFVDGHPVGDIGAGAAFGELALMYSSPRAATVQVRVCRRVPCMQCVFVCLCVCVFVCLCVCMCVAHVWDGKHLMMI